jgi:hypothetical protein
MSEYLLVERGARVASNVDVRLNQSGVEKNYFFTIFILLIYSCISSSTGILIYVAYLFHQILIMKKEI